jgi:hypothetical protein
MISCSSEGEESVKAGDGLDEAAANNAAPAMARKQTGRDETGDHRFLRFPQSEPYSKLGTRQFGSEPLKDDDLTYVLKQAATTSTVVVSCTGRVQGP